MHISGRTWINKCWVLSLDHLILINWGHFMDYMTVGGFSPLVSLSPWTLYCPWCSWMSAVGKYGFEWLWWLEKLRKKFQFSTLTSQPWVRLWYNLSNESIYWSVDQKSSILPTFSTSTDHFDQNKTRSHVFSLQLLTYNSFPAFLSSATMADDEFQTASG